jgi:basic amino acid/polyamine antiporter, APA family
MPFRCFSEDQVHKAEVGREIPRRREDGGRRLSACQAGGIRGTSASSDCLQTALAFILLRTSSFDALLTYIGFTLGIGTTATVVALLVLRHREGKALQVPGFPLVPWLFLAEVVAMTTFTVVQKPMESLVGFATILASLASWLVSRRASGRT